MQFERGDILYYGEESYRAATALYSGIFGSSSIIIDDEIKGELIIDLFLIFIVVIVLTKQRFCYLLFVTVLLDMCGIKTKSNIEDSVTIHFH